MSNIGGWEQEDLISNIQFSARILKHCTSQPDSSHISSFIFSLFFHLTHTHNTSIGNQTAATFLVLFLFYSFIKHIHTIQV